VSAGEWTPVLRAVATVLQIVGIVVMAIGVWRTWQEFGPPGAIRAALGRTWARLVEAARALWRRVRRRRAVTVTGGGGVHVRATAFDARVRIGYPPVDLADLADLAGLSAAVSLLSRRVSEIGERLADTQEHAHDEGKAWRKAAADLTEQLEREVQELKVRDQRVALEGILWETAGLFITAIGLVLQFVAGG
jgi:hypothetical protein